MPVRTVPPLRVSVSGVPRQTPAKSRVTLTDACREFESLFINYMIKEMRKSVPRGEGVLALSSGEEIFGEFLDQELARRIAGAGGMGVARIVERQQVSGTGGHGTVAAKENPKKSDILYRTVPRNRRPGGM